MVTVALFGPESVHRSLDGLSPTGANSPMSGSGGNNTELEKDAMAKLVGTSGGGGGGGGGGASSSSVMAVAARGQVILAAGYSGEIKIYENIGLPQWL